MKESKKFSLGEPASVNFEEVSERSVEIKDEFLSPQVKRSKHYPPSTRSKGKREDLFKTVESFGDLLSDSKKPEKVVKDYMTRIINGRNNSHLSKFSSSRISKQGLKSPVC